MPRPNKPDVVTLLQSVVDHVISAREDAEASSGAWADESLRRRGLAAYETSSGTKSIAPGAMSDFEKAVNILMSNESIRGRWDAPELWSVAASAVVAASAEQDRKAAVRARVKHIISVANTLVAMVVSNTRWFGPLLEMDKSAIGLLDNSLVEKIKDMRSLLNGSGARLPVDLHEGLVDAWRSRIEAQYAFDSEPVCVYAGIVPRCGSRATSELRTRFSNLCDLTLLFTNQPESIGAIPLRGATNRPGLRGLRMDRRAVRLALQGGADGELLADILYASELRFGNHTYWYSADPFNLSDALSKVGLRERVLHHLLRDEPISRRILVAARWYGEAFWSDQYNDAMLRLGIAFDALLGSKAGLPSSVLAERFALLERDVSKRENASRQFKTYYSMRSAIVHGGVPSEIDRTTILDVMHDVRLVAERLENIDKTTNLRSEDDITRMFEALRWGTVSFV